MIAVYCYQIHYYPIYQYQYTSPSDEFLLRNESFHLSNNSTHRFNAILLRCCANDFPRMNLLASLLNRILNILIRSRRSVNFNKLILQRDINTRNTYQLTRGLLGAYQRVFSMRDQRRRNILLLTRLKAERYQNKPFER